MKDYKKPMIISMGTSEGVYLASGEVDGDGECYSAEVTVDQWDTAEKRFHVYVYHKDADHHSHGQRIVITFPNSPTSCTFNETYKVGSHKLEGNTLTIIADRHQNQNDNTSFNFGVTFSDVPAGTKPGQPTAVCYDTAHHVTDGSECGGKW